MNEDFQQALKAEDLEAIRKIPKTDLHNHGLAGADPASVAAILGTKCTPLDHRLTSMAEMHAWASENLGNVDPRLSRPQLFEADRWPTTCQVGPALNRTTPTSC
jgi:hypothetical protein